MTLSQILFCLERTYEVDISWSEIQIQFFDSQGRNLERAAHPYSQEFKQNNFLLWDGYVHVRYFGGYEVWELIISKGELVS